MKACFLPHRTQIPPLPVLFFLVLRVFPAGEAAAAENPFFTWDLLWTGSLRNNFTINDDTSPAEEGIFSGSTLFNRGEFSATFSGQDISFRFLAADKRLFPFGEKNTKSGFDPGLGVYHNASGSRFLLGVQREYGLPARLRNIWLRSVPFVESRNYSSRDLKTEPAAGDSAETSLHLALPPGLLPGLDAFASAALDEEQNHALGAGIGFGGSAAELRLEGFYAEKELPAEKKKAWFSSAPSLPERDFKIHALALFFTTPFLSLASDLAYSETFAWGRGVYWNFALRLGNKPWRFSLASDGAESRFVDRNGGASGAGFRLAAGAEHSRPGSGLLRFGGIFRAPGQGEPFDRASLLFYYRPSARRIKSAEGRRTPFHLSRISLAFDRNAETPEKTLDSLDALFGFRFAFFSGSILCAIQGRSVLDADGKIPPLYQPPLFGSFESLRVAGELGWKAGIFNFQTKLGHTARAEKAPLWEASLNASFRPGKWGRVGLRIATPDFPEKWNYTLSWRFQGRGF